MITSILICFPYWVTGCYNNYTEWGEDIHDNNREDIHAVLKIPPDLRVQWGMYKNLLGGVTTVANHGKQLEINDPFITVLQDYCSLHSVAFERNWRYKLNRPFHPKPAYVHIACRGGNGCFGEAGNKIIASLEFIQPGYHRYSWGRYEGGRCCPV